MFVWLQRRLRKVKLTNQERQFSGGKYLLSFRRLMCIQRITTHGHTHEKIKSLAVFLQCNPETESL